MEEATAPKKRKTSIEGFPEVLSRTGQEKYGEELNFQLGFSYLTLLLAVNCATSIHLLVQYHVQELLYMKMTSRYCFSPRRWGKLRPWKSFWIYVIMTNKQYKFCPGIDPEVYQSTYFSKIRYHIKSVRCLDIPIKLVDSLNCSLWHKLARNASILEKDMDSVPCGGCKRLLKWSQPTA